VSCTEIVDREVAFEFPQRFGNVFRQLQIVNDLVFSNLQGSNPASSLHAGEPRAASGEWADRPKPTPAR
ncbi:MAG: hypothetical protein WCB77_20265, partial [Pseudolabrys sp.]